MPKRGVPVGVLNAARKRNPIVQNGFLKHVKFDCAWQKTRTASMNIIRNRFRKKFWSPSGFSMKPKFCKSLCFFNWFIYFLSFVIDIIICMVLRFVFRIKCKVFSLISFLGPQRVKYLMCMCWISPEDYSIWKYWMKVSKIARFIVWIKFLIEKQALNLGKIFSTGFFQFVWLSVCTYITVLWLL
jgi:hypothetical protein